MSKVKFVLDPAPTFKAKVDIPVHGSDTVPVEFEFKHRSRDAMDELLSRVSSGSLKDVDSLQEVIVGWELDDPFTAESIDKLVQNYQGAAQAIVRKYMSEITQARLGN